MNCQYCFVTSFDTTLYYLGRYKPSSPFTQELHDLFVFADLTSVTRWLDYISTFGHLNQRKFAQWYTNFAKVGPKFCQIIYKASKIAQDFEDIAKVAKFRQIWSHWT